MNRQLGLRRAYTSEQDANPTQVCCLQPLKRTHMATCSVRSSEVQQPANHLPRRTFRGAPSGACVLVRSETLGRPDQGRRGRLWVSIVSA